MHDVSFVLLIFNKLIIFFSRRMKLAVLFSLVVLVIVAFLNPASGCDCVKYLQKSTKMPAVLTKAGIKIPDSLAEKGPKVVCAKMPKVKAIIAKLKKC